MTELQAADVMLRREADTIKLPVADLISLRAVDSIKLQVEDSIELRVEDMTLPPAVNTTRLQAVDAISLLEEHVIQPQVDRAEDVRLIACRIKYRLGHFARARCGDCGHDILVAFSCKGRGVCPSCTTRRMGETAAHLTDHVFPRLPVRQWVLSVPKRLRYFMQRDGVVLRIFLRVIAQTLQSNSPGAANLDKAALHIGAVAFIHRFGSSLNEHVHFHVCAVDGVFEAVVGEASEQGTRTTATSVMFHSASGIGCARRAVGPSTA